MDIPISEIAGILAGIAVAAFMTWQGYQEFEKHEKTGKWTQLTKGDKIIITGVIGFFVILLIWAMFTS